MVIFKQFCNIVDKTLFPERFKKGLSCNRGIWPIFAKIASGVAKAASVAKAAAIGLGKGAMAIGKGTWQVAQGAGKGFIGKDASILGKGVAGPLGKTQMLQQNLRNVGVAIGRNVSGIVGMKTGINPSVDTLIQGKNLSLPSRISSMMSSAMQSPLKSQVPNQTQDTQNAGSISPVEVTDTENAPVITPMGQQQAMPIEQLTPADIEYYRQLRLREKQGSPGFY